MRLTRNVGALQSGFTMRMGKLLIVAVTLAGSAGCARYYHMPPESEPHATLTFEKGNGWNERPTPLKLNGLRRNDHLIGERRTFLIGVGTMRLEVGESIEGSLFTSGPAFTCELSFEAEAARSYLVTMRLVEDRFLYIVTGDNGRKVAECEAQQVCESTQDCPPPPSPGGQGTGEGAIVTRDDAPVYRKADGDGVKLKLKRGDAVAADSGKYNDKATWQFQEEAGRVRVIYLVGGEGRGGYWMSLHDLAKFTYSFCKIDPRSALSTSPGWPFTLGLKQDWNVCFKEARDDKLRELGAGWAQEPVPAPP